MHGNTDKRLDLLLIEEVTRSMAVHMEPICDIYPVTSYRKKVTVDPIRITMLSAMREPIEFLDIGPNDSERRELTSKQLRFSQL